MFRKTTILIIFPMLFSFFSIAQEEGKINYPKGTKKLKKEADWALDKGDVFVALKYYEKLVELEGDDMEHVYSLAYCKMKSRDYEGAEELFSEVAEKSKDEYPLSVFYYAKMQKANGKYSEAKNNFEKFRKLSRGLKDPLWSKKNRNEIAGCDLAIRVRDSLVLKTVENLKGDVNHPHIEFSPIPLGENKMIYGSNKVDGIEFYTIKKDKYKSDGIKKPVRKLYVANKIDKKWVTEGEWRGPFNDEDIHTGNGAFSLDGKRFYFTRCDKNEKGKTICKIFYSDKEDGTWSVPVLLEGNINLKGYTSTQPAVGKESKKGREVLYFVSDRPEGKGGWDIWYSVYNAKKKTFSEVKNVGRKINSIGTECTPYYHPDTNDFYFSSNGHPTVGGLDVFKVSGEKSKWEDAVNLGFPINSPADDLDFIYGSNDQSGFLVSNRKGGTALGVETCCDDIYYFSPKKEIEEESEVTEEVVVEKEEPVEEKTIPITFKLFDENNGKEINNATVRFYDAENGKLIPLKSKNGKGIEYELEEGVKYDVEISKYNYKTSRETFTASENKEYEFGLTPLPKVVETKVTAVVPQTTTINKVEMLDLSVGDAPLVLEDIYFDFDSDKLRPESIRIIDDILLHFLERRPRAIIMVGAHTDSKGNDVYNEGLSQRRAQSVISYLIRKKGINPKRLQARGFGEKVPRALNENPDGSDNPDGRQKNRRVEFSVVGEL